MTEEQKKSAVSPISTFSKETHAQARRSLAKTFSWRALASIDTFIIAYLVTGEASAGA